MDKEHVLEKRAGPTPTKIVTISLPPLTLLATNPDGTLYVASLARDDPRTPEVIRLALNPEPVANRDESSSENVVEPVDPMQARWAHFDRLVT